MNSITPYKVLHDHLCIPRHIIRHFLKFILEKGVYVPYIGRLVTSSQYANIGERNKRMGTEHMIREIINYSFIWNPYNASFPDLYFNTMKSNKWSLYHDMWQDEIISSQYKQRKRVSDEE